MYPIVEQYGFKYFKVGNRYVRAIRRRNGFIYADNYPVTDSDIPTEPTESEFVEMLKRQESKK